MAIKQKVQPRLRPDPFLITGSDLRVGSGHRWLIAVSRLWMLQPNLLKDQERDSLVHPERELLKKIERTLGAPSRLLTDPFHVLFQ